MPLAKTDRVDCCSVRGTHVLAVPTFWEYRSVRIGLRHARTKNISPCTPAPIDVQNVIRCGMGIDSATRLAERLSTAQISELTLLGVCGGLVPGLEIGDVVCANASCIQLSNGQTQCIDTPLTPQLQAAVGEMHGEFKIHYGRVICTTSVILSSRKRDLAESSGASAVEMESAPLAQWALSAGIPFNHIRVVVDCWDSHPLLLQPLSIVRELARGIPKIRESCRALRILARLSRTLFRASSARL